MSEPVIEIGAAREESIVVDDRVAISFLGIEAARVLATPQMIQHMEITSRNLLFPMLEEGYDSVGTVVNVRHLGGAPMGTEVIFRSTIVSVEGRRVTFQVEARNLGESIGEGTHERFIIHKERFAAKMARKRGGAG